MAGMRANATGIREAGAELIRSLAATIARRFHPLRIILFGSHAYGRPHRDSDVDILVIMRPKANPARIRCALPHEIPMDILVRTPAEIRRRLSMGDPFIREILLKGRLLYDARRKRVG